MTKERNIESVTIWHAELPLLHEIWETNPCWCLSHLFFETIHMEPSSCTHKRFREFAWSACVFSTSTSAVFNKWAPRPAVLHDLEEDQSIHLYLVDDLDPKTPMRAMCHADQETGNQTLIRSPSLCSASRCERVSQLMTFWSSHQTKVEEI